MSVTQKITRKINQIFTSPKRKRIEIYVDDNRESITSIMQKVPPRSQVLMHEMICNINPETGVTYLVTEWLDQSIPTKANNSCPKALSRYKMFSRARSALRTARFMKDLTDKDLKELNLPKRKGLYYFQVNPEISPARKLEEAKKRF